MPAKDAKSNVELYQAAVQGGPEAFGPIVQRYQDAVFGVALARLRNFHEAEDVAQHVFVEAFQRLDGLKDSSRLGAWLRSITIHRCIDRLRGQRERPDAEACEMRASDRAQPSVELERRELRNQVLAAIGRLSKTQRETTTLFYINGYSIAEVASVQEVPVGTVKRRLHDACERLKEELIGMVENVLKSEAPKDDFAKRVFELLSGLRARKTEDRIPWEQVVSELKKIGSRGIEGFVKALSSPYSSTRITAASMATKVPDTKEFIVELLRESLNDPNKKVRRFAVDSLLNCDADQRRKRKELVPLIVPLLHDPSKRVRRRAAYELIDYAADVPIREPVKALLVETDREARKLLKMLLHAMVCDGEKKIYPE